MVKGTVKEVDARGAVIELAEGVEGYLRAADIKEERVDDATRELSVGDEVEAKFISLDRKNRTLSLSIRAKDDAELAEALKEYKQGNVSAGTTSLGDLLKEQLEQDS
jgi:small subunit ribosomal protein S1